MEKGGGGGAAAAGTYGAEGLCVLWWCDGGEGVLKSSLSLVSSSLCSWLQGPRAIDSQRGNWELR